MRNGGYLFVLLTLLNAGCVSMPNPLVPAAKPEVRAAPPEATAFGPGGMPDLLSYLAEINSLDVADRERLFQTTTTAFETSPSLPNQVRLAVFLSAPHLLPTDQRQTRQTLERLSRAERPLPDDLRTLAEVRLRELEEEEEFNRENKVLREQVAKLNATLGERVAQNQAEIGKLATALAEAEAKIRALTSIEEAIKRNGQTAPTNP